MEISEYRLPVDLARLYDDAEGEGGGRKMLACSGCPGAADASKLNAPGIWNCDAKDMVGNPG